MELVFQNKLTHYLGNASLNDHGRTLVSLLFRDSSGERFSIELPSTSIPSEIYSAQGPELARALQEVLDNCVKAGLSGVFRDVDSRTPKSKGREHNEALAYY
ncbi:MAG: hypothetical protein IPK79_04340 [Vampirovibrionales bacterium]|nr:hypothetical protein [Vampirovibrionales bacterium]